ncbi:MAG: hypothetical protein C5B51_17335 [Terriglobia bacterium]|nr:MAG: hypothetical protein C5B51_17335 [Terriglobia bacterium]
MTEDSKARWKRRFKLATIMGGCWLAPVVPFYTAFVVQNLWNWFLADALHASTISYWQSFGILLGFWLLAQAKESESGNETRWNRAFSMLEAIVPQENLTILKETFRKEDESWPAIVAAVAPQTRMAIANSFALLIGWATHTFLI